MVDTEISSFVQKLQNDPYINCPNCVRQKSEMLPFEQKYPGSHASGIPSVAETWSTRESITCIGAVKESMPQDAYIKMHCCMHFSDDWDDDDWDETYSDEKYHPSPDVERHGCKFEHIEDGFNKRWKEVVKFGRWGITANESRVAGWYNSAITIGPEPEPIRTGATKC